MKNNKVFLIAILLLSLLTIQVANARTFKVALFIPQSTPFWTLVSNFAQEAAQDLKIELSVYDAEKNQFLMVEQVKEVLSSPDKVDAILFQNFKLSAPALIKMAEEAGVYSFLFNSPIHEKAEIGKPRERYKFWIGEMLPDDTGISEVIVRLLINEAQRKKKVGKDKKVHLIGISGRIADTASITRIKGLYNAIAGRQDVVLHQVFNTDWGVEEGQVKALGALNRYPETTVVWSASYNITNGILKAINQHKLTVGKDIYTNSVGLMERVLKQVAEGEIIATTGGHYVEAALVLVLIYDFLHGIDFAEEGTSSMRTPMPLITKKNVEVFLKNANDEKLSKENLRKIKFDRYSKKLNPKVKRYNFDIEDIFSQLSK